MIIELKGVEFENKGAELMLRAILQRIHTYWPDAQIAMTPNPKSPYLLRASVGAWQKISLRKMFVDINCLSYHCSYMTRYLKKWGIVTESDIDVILDASGFSYSDQWGSGMSIRHAAGEIERFAAHGKPYIFMPQAFGPFADKKVKDLIKNSFPKAALVCPREQDSYHHICNITGEHENIRQFSDFTNVVDGKVPEWFFCENRTACIIPNKNMVNPRNKNKAWLASYENLLLQAVELYRERGLTPIFLNHEGDEDGALIDSLNAKLSDPLLVITEADPLQVKGIISACEAVFCSRFHGCVSALSNGIPCISTSWSHKYERLYEDYEAAELLLEPECSKEELTDLIDLTLVTESSIRKRIFAKSSYYKAQTEVLWDQIKLIIDNATK